MENINLTELKNEILESWRREFGLEYLYFFLDRGKVMGYKYWSNRGDADEFELRIANKYEITIFDCYVRVRGVITSKGG
ncbi:MAG: hypothetical protein AAB875_03910 [Patescibacteria group bacterium]